MASYNLAKNVKFLAPTVVYRLLAKEINKRLKFVDANANKAVDTNKKHFHFVNKYYKPLNILN